MQELADRYGRHTAFAGVAVQLSGNGYAILPGLDWGLDDATVARFQRETGIELPDRGENRFAVRQTLLTGEHADAWRTWRAAQIANFYRQMAQIIQADGGTRRLILTTEDMFSTPEMAAQMRPAVMAALHVDRLMLDLGIDRVALSQTPGIVVLPTKYVESMTPLTDRATDVEINSSAVAESSGSSRGMLFYHRPQRQRLASFDAKSPMEAYTFLASQTLPDGARRAATLCSDAEYPSSGSCFRRRRAFAARSRRCDAARAATVAAAAC